MKMSSVWSVAAQEEDAFGEFPVANELVVRIDEYSDQDLTSIIGDADPTASSSSGTNSKHSSIKKSTCIQDAMVVQTISRLSKNARASCRKEVCDTVVRCALQRQSDPVVALTVLDATKRWAKQQNSRTAHALIQSGLALMCLEIGKQQMDDVRTLIATLDTMQYVVRCAKHLAIEEYKTHGLDEFIKQVNQKHGSDEGVRIELENLKTSIESNGSSPRNSILGCFA